MTVTGTTSPVHSALYEGWLTHARSVPVHHAFRYRIALCYLDLSEVDRVLAQHPLWSRKRGRPVQFRRSDYLGDAGVPLAEAARAAVGPGLGDGPVRLLAHLRTWAWCFNPLSLYFCFDEAGETVRSVLASVTNTPWGERHEYVIPAAEDGRVDTETRKSLHVSPFFGMEQTHRFVVEPPGDTLRITMENYEAGQRVFRAGLLLRRRTLDRPAMTALLVRYPFMTWRVSAGIYAQAARLALKGVPFHRHPPPRLPGSTTGVQRP